MNVKNIAEYPDTFLYRISSSYEPDLDSPVKNSRVSQTEPNLSENSSELHGPGTTQHVLPADTQTDPYDSENLAEGAMLAEENSDQPPEYQTDSESTSQEPGVMTGESKKTRKRSVKSLSGENADTPPEPAPANATMRGHKKREAPQTIGITVFLMVRLSENPNCPK